MKQFPCQATISLGAENPSFEISKAQASISQQKNLSSNIVFNHTRGA
jgi:hypothetical protein